MLASEQEAASHYGEDKSHLKGWSPQAEPGMVGGGRASLEERGQLKRSPDQEIRPGENGTHIPSLCLSQESAYRT